MSARLQALRKRLIWFTVLSSSFLAFSFFHSHSRALQHENQLLSSSLSPESSSLSWLERAPSASSFQIGARFSHRDLYQETQYYREQRRLHPQEDNSDDRSWGRLLLTSSHHGRQRNAGGRSLRDRILVDEEETRVAKEMWHSGRGAAPVYRTWRQRLPSLDLQPPRPAMPRPEVLQNNIDRQQHL